MTPKLLEKDLQQAALKNSIVVTKVILGGQVAVSKIPALRSAVLKRCVEIVTLLIAAGPTDQEMEDALLYATRHSSTQILQTMLALCQYPHSVINQALVRAVRHSGAQVQALLGAGADAGVSDNEPLRIAFYPGLYTLPRKKMSQWMCVEEVHETRATRSSSMACT
ncbi:hypothetical protein HDV00_009825 [Rhizophlyctis rosea]|nr:hypothetical protein HDV00_009825 [Rhizophlyctis rosea]